MNQLDKLQMKKYEIWIEGYICQGDRGRAEFLGTQEAESFHEAVKRFYAQHKPNLTTFDPNTLTDWGCRLFDNEADARKLNG